MTIYSEITLKGWIFPSPFFHDLENKHRPPAATLFPLQVSRSAQLTEMESRLLILMKKNTVTSLLNNLDNSVICHKQYIWVPFLKSPKFGKTFLVWKFHLSDFIFKEETSAKANAIWSVQLARLFVVSPLLRLNHKPVKAQVQHCCRTDRSHQANNNPQHLTQNSLNSADVVFEAHCHSVPYRYL